MRPPKWMHPLSNLDACSLELLKGEFNFKLSDADLKHVIASLSAAPEPGTSWNSEGDQDGTTSRPRVTLAQLDARDRAAWGVLGVH